MSTISYRLLLALFALLSLSGVFATFAVSWMNQREPEVVDCHAWQNHPQEGRFRLTGCRTVPLERRGRSTVVMVGMGVYEWTTRDPEMMRLSDPSPEGRRALARHLVSHRLVDIDIEATRMAANPRRMDELRDPREPRTSIWVGVIPFFLFGLPMCWLVRKKRKWRAAQLAWERSQGIITEGDKPTAF